MTQNTTTAGDNVTDSEPTRAASTGSSSLDPAISDPPTIERLAADLERLTDLDREDAHDVVLALLGASNERDLPTSDSFQRQLGHRLRMASVRRGR